MYLNFVITRCFIVGVIFFFTSSDALILAACQNGTTLQQQDDDKQSKTYLELSELKATLIDNFAALKDSDDQAEIAFLRKIVDVDKKMIAGLDAGDSAFVVGIETDPKQLMDDTLEQAILHSGALTDELQVAEMFDDGVTQAQQTIVLSRKLFGDENWRTHNSILDLALAQWLADADDDQLKKRRIAKGFIEKGYQGFRKQDWPVAIGNFRKAKSLFEELQMQGTVPYGRAVSNLAELIAKSGDLKAAEPAYLESLKVNDALFLKRSPTNAAMRTTFAMLYQKTGRPEKAIAILKEGDEILKIASGENSLQLANNLYVRATFYQELGENRKSLEIYFEALKMLGALGEGESAMSFKILGKLHGVMESLKQHDAAASAGLAAARLAVDLFGEESEENVKWLMLAAGSLRADGKFESSVERYNQAKTILEKNDQFEKDEAYIHCLGLLAVSQFSLGKPDEAIQMSKKAMELARAIDENSILYLARAQNLAYLYVTSKKYDDAESIFAQILPVLKKGLGEDHDEYRKVMVDRGVNLILNEKWDESVKVWLVIKSLEEKKLGKSSPEYLATLQYLLKAYGNLGDDDSAKKIQEEMDRIKDR